MLETLRDAVDDLPISPDGDELTAAFSLLSRLGAKVTAAVGDFDAADGWVPYNATSMTSWLRRQCGLVGNDAGRFVRFAHLLRSLPVTSSAWEDGTLSEGQVKAILANVKRKTVALFAEHEAELIPVLAP